VSTLVLKIYSQEKREFKEENGDKWGVKGIADEKFATNSLKKKLFLRA